MIILVTGGFGFQGVHLTKRLLEEGHDVFVLSSCSEHSMNNESWLRKNIDCSKLRVIVGSINDYDLLSKMPSFDVIFHLAAKVNVDESLSNPDIFVQTNVQGTLNVLKAAVKNNVPRIIIASSCEVYGGGVDLHEDSPMNPQSPYAASKAGAERLAYAYAQCFPIQVDIVRPFNVYGPRQKNNVGGAVIPIFLKKAREGKSMTIFGDGSQGRDFIHVNDVIEGYINILNTPSDKKSRVFTFGTGRLVTVEEIAETIQKFFPGSTIEYVDERPGEVQGFIAKNTLKDYFPKVEMISFEDGMRSLL